MKPMYLTMTWDRLTERQKDAALRYLESPCFNKSLIDHKDPALKYRVLESTGEFHSIIFPMDLKI